MATEAVPVPTDKKPEPVAPADDLKSQVAALLALTVMEKRSAERPQRGGLGAALGAATALLAAVGSLMGAFQALRVSMEASEDQKAIARHQGELDLQNKLIAENQRFTNLYYQGAGISCGGIPTDDMDLWDRYCNCAVPGTQHCSLTLDFKKIEPAKRVECVKPLGICK